MLDKLRNSGVDAVVSIVLLSKRRERNYTPGGTYYNNFYGCYTTTYGRIYSEGYYQLDTRYFWESNFYDPGSKELFYSVQSESFDPGSAGSLSHEYGKMIVKNMAKQGIIK